ncbi:MAG: SDR family NAD(P)-dependent oxidoreductase [Rhodospirillales bacterium]|jgi:NAD(P)-dependent dehydrogenase (short-subunit alcohol dehydrogenase family)|tara:strand:+ start:2888 stop:3640 length:753 start_codon:yes stop_codon:yes gene_type:complete
MTGQRFENQSAIITGGARGIGLAIAQRLESEGARVSLWEIDPAAVEEARSTFKNPDNVHSCTVNVGDPASVDAAGKKTIADLEKVDVMVNSAGVAGANALVKEYDVEEWQKVIDINLNGVFYCCRALVGHMEDNGYGRIVNIASIAGKEGNPTASAYSASKAGVIGLTKSLGKETALSGVTVNCITPAAVKTAIFDQISQKHIDFMLSKIPMSRFGKVEEMASLVAWLASEECSFSTGGVFDISGGRATY